MKSLEPDAVINTSTLLQYHTEAGDINEGEEWTVVIYKSSDIYRGHKAITEHSSQASNTHSYTHIQYVYV